MDSWGLSIYRALIVFEFCLSVLLLSEHGERLYPQFIFPLFYSYSFLLHQFGVSRK